MAAGLAQGGASCDKRGVWVRPGNEQHWCMSAGCIACMCSTPSLLLAAVHARATDVAHVSVCTHVPESHKLTLLMHHDGGQAPQYGAALKEKRRQYHYPKSRAPAEDSFDEDSSADEY